MIKFFKNRCYNDGKKHKFKKRITEKDRRCEFAIERASIEALRTITRLYVYCGDVCVWCGKVVNNEKTD